MPNNNPVRSRVLPKVSFAVLFAVFGLAACEGGGGAITTTTTSPPTTYSITASAGANGAVTPAGTTTVTQGTNQSYTITPNPGYMIATLVVDGAAVAISSTYTFTNVQATHTISATFAVAVTHTITASAGANGAVTPAGTTTVTQGTNQAYNITPNPGYTTATLVVDGAAVAISSTFTFTNVQANHTISATFSAAPAGNIVLSLVPARTSGVAPLSVFFDASATTDTGVTTRPFHDLEYTWSFGDPGAGTWANGARTGVSSKNSATGPVATHVFETPGAYTVSLTAFDGVNTNTTSTTITVQNPDTVFVGANTICFSTSANYAGCPTGALQMQTTNFTSAINGNIAPNRRLLFRRGETFTAATSARINQSGPGIIGAYGTGVAPVVQMTGNTTVLLVSSPTTPTLKDWRVMDLDLDGTSSTTDSFGIRPDGGFNQFLALRVNGLNINQGVEAHVSVLNGYNAGGNPGHTVWEDWAVVDSSFKSSVAFGCSNCSWRVYLAGKRVVIQGNFLDLMADPLAQHVIRSGYMSKGIISNNTLVRSGPTQHIIKLHAPVWQIVGVTDPTGVGVYTEQVVIDDNKIVAGNNNWLVGLGPQNAQNDERVRDIIVERNWFQAGPQTGAALLVWGSETTVRNNICDMTGATSHRCFHVNQRGIEPPPDNVRIYNNTIFSSSTGNFYGVTLGSNATNVSVINNLGSAPSATSPTMINGAGGAGLISSNNLIASPASLFVNTTPTIPVHFGLQSLPNPARDTGLSIVPVFSDFFRTGRPQNGVIDIGAVEGP